MSPMILSFQKYIIEGGIVKSFSIQNSQELLSMIKPSWIDTFKKNKKYCYQTNIGRIEISMGRYEQFDIDKDFIDLKKPINFEFKEEMFQKSFYEDKYSDLIVKKELNSIDSSETILLKTGVGLVFYDNELCSVFVDLEEDSPH